MSAFKILLSSAAIGMTMMACTSGPRSVASRPQAIENKAPARHEALARAELRKDNFEAALVHAERAVEQSPRDVGYRMLLADLYLKNGRFASAEEAFADVLRLVPDNGRATFSLALAEIANGKRDMALARLDRLAETAPPADLGLAYALAGQADRAVAMLEGAARADGATARVRQNLALAYAMAGDWQRARITASQDLSPADLPRRMEEWASFVQPQTSAHQVAAVFGVVPRQDPGQPLRLALAPAQNQTVALASVDSAPLPDIVTASEPAPLVLASYAPDSAQVSQPVYASVERADLPPANQPEPSTPKKVVQGRFVVQLAAYASQGAIRQGWSQLSRRYALHGTPHSAVASVPGKGKMHRLSVGYGTQAEALRACSTIRRKGGACFVRTNSGDKPLLT